MSCTAKITNAQKENIAENLSQHYLVFELQGQMAASTNFIHIPKLNLSLNNLQKCKILNLKTQLIYHFVKTCMTLEQS